MWVSGTPQWLWQDDRYDFYADKWRVAMARNVCRSFANGYTETTLDYGNVMRLFAPLFDLNRADLAPLKAGPNPLLTVSLILNMVASYKVNPVTTAGKFATAVGYMTILFQNSNYTFKDVPTGTIL